MAPAQSQLVVVSSLSHAGLLSNVSELSPLKFWLEAATGLQLELFVVQTRVRKNYFSRFLLVLSQQPFVCDPRAQSGAVGQALSLSGQFPLLQAV